MSLLSSSYPSTHSRSSPPIPDLIDSLMTHRIRTLNELVRIERIAAFCKSESDARAFQVPMTAAWANYVDSHQLLVDLHGLTPNFPFSGEIITTSYVRVINDPLSNRSWNLAWLCLTKIKEDGLIPFFAAIESAKPEMWGDKTPTKEEIDQLAMFFEMEWSTAVETMFRHWPVPPTWC
ncbi:hypothetical protein MRS44_007099 [Fusarium solani]|uniref:Uncharacterized protein n=1 Tax=Fusarium solani TaxID=169388 RepID=A0A9P9H3C8_FUSSL|nr:uncharacterized protein B0J15DRAFT_468141 [Fusarium solani]KAH7249608.1 hypothetical protein B0J15DRAFT_468141 [Fusarium solani]KAJ3462313.1 hypothetical protein MRS44_007099 [Fusarium solani]